MSKEQLLETILLASIQYAKEYTQKDTFGVDEMVEITDIHIKLTEMFIDVSEDQSSKIEDWVHKLAERFKTQNPKI